MTLRIGIVGTGGMGRHHAVQVAQRDDARITALCDINAEATENLVNALGGETQTVVRYSQWQDLLAGGDVDGVIIATPHTQHSEQVSGFLDAGMHVLVEKPMATTADDARKILASAENSRKVLAIAYQRHGDGRFIRAREILQSGTIGEIRLIHVIIAQDCVELFRPGASWRADPSLSGGGHFHGYGQSHKRHPAVDDGAGAEAGAGVYQSGW